MHESTHLLHNAKRSFINADHMVFMTYPALKEPKLLTASIKSIEEALRSGMQALVNYDRHRKRIPPGTPGKDFALFQRYCLKRYNFPKELMQTFTDIKTLQTARKKSPIEFTRKGKVIICSEDYTMKVIDEKMIKSYLRVTRNFLEQVEGIINV